MSHHLDQSNPQLDISDVYCFRGTMGTVFVMNVSPMQFPASGFDREALYEFKIDTNGDYLEDVAWRATFPIDSAGVQQLKLEQLTGSAARDRNATGEVITPAGSKPEQIITCSNGVKLFAGERGDAFFNDARLTVETKRALNMHTAPNYSWFTPETAQNTFKDTNVSTIVLEVPSAITGSGTIGFWGNTAVKENGVWHQFQHAAGPLVGFLYDFSGGSAGADYNASHPKDHLMGRPKRPGEPAQQGFWKQVADDTAAVVEAMGTYDDGTYGKNSAAEYGAYVADTLLPDVLRYRVGTSAEWGSRVRNGKGLTESAPEAIYELVLNRHLEMGLDPSDATGKLLDQFPYLSEPIATG
ncbi:DUF4331 family protein [Streptomyces sp. 8N114]|uniref:DUF4331 family protein n=1 Tax=Streptomyces sp. 8N114 TaxID=3457419 RepID=UPI003FD6189B